MIGFILKYEKKFFFKLNKTKLWSSLQKTTDPQYCLFQVEALLSKTQGGMPGSKVAKVEDHEAFLTATASLLHPSNFQV